jgi:hypothetical protein
MRIVGRATPKPTKAEILEALEILLRYVTMHGTSGNPYCIPEVKHGLRVLARDRGIRRHLDVELRDLAIPAIRWDSP